MNHPAFTYTKWLMLLIGLGIIIGAYRLAAPQDQWVLYGMGASFALVGLFIILWGHLSQQKTQQLLQTGQLIQAEFQQVERNTQLKVNGMHPFRVVAQWHDSVNNALHIYRSENLWFDPSPFVQGRKIPVYVDLHNPRRYHVDLSFLPAVHGIS